jgi:ubiquinone biosynthesis protein
MLSFVRQTRHLGRYRQIVQVFWRHGFGYLLEQIGVTRIVSLPRRAIMRVPATQPVGVAEHLCQALIELGPAFIKIGQLLSSRPDLVPPNFITELEKLQDTVPAFPSEQAIKVIESELGKPVSELFKEFDTTPLAAASLGQVHAAVLHTGEQVAIKVQRPDIQSLIETDLEIFSDLAGLAQERTSLGESYDLVEIAWEFSSTVRRELDYTREGRNADRFRRLFDGNPMVHIPKVYWEYTSTRVLTTERLFGIKINNVEKLREAGLDPVKLADNSTQLIFVEFFKGFFHSDPHAGNFFGLPGNVVGAVDFGQVGSMDREMTRQVMLMVSAIINRDPEEALRSIENMGMVKRYNMTPAMRRDMQIFIDSMSGQPLSAISAHVTGGELFSIVRRHKLTMPGPVALLMKSMIMMEGIGLQLNPDLNVFEIAKPYAKQALAEEFSAQTISKRLFTEAQIMGDAALELPQQVGNILQRVNEGELRIQTSEQEIRTLSRALISSANYLALALVLSAIILGLSLIAVAVSIGGWSGPVPNILIVMGVMGAVVAALFLVLALLRGRDI